MPGHRQTDSGSQARSACALGASLGVARPMALIARGLGRSVEYLRRANALEQHLARGRRVTLPVDPSSAQLDRGEIERGRDLGGLHLGGELGLRSAKAPKRAIGRRIGGHRTPSDAHNGAPFP